MASDITPPPDESGPKSKTKKGSWLSTNDWLGMPPAQTPLPPPEPVSSSERTDRHPSPDSEEVQLRPADTEQLEEIRKAMPSSTILARGELAEITGTAVAEDDDADSGIDLATPPGGATTGPPSLSKILKATGTKSDIIRNSGSDSSDALYTPTAPGSGWLTGNRQPPKTGGSRVDIGNLPRKPEEISDIFNGARADSASGPASGTGSNLLPGMSGVGRSSLFADSRSGSGGLGAGAESDLFAGLTGAGSRGSSVYDDSSKRTKPLPGSKHDDDGDDDSVSLIDDMTDTPGRPINSGPPSSARLADRLLAGLAESGGHARPDFDTLDKSQSGSNLFDDVTAMDIDLGSDPGASGASGLNWLDPNRTGAQDSGPGSSIFQKPPGFNSSDPGHVDLSSIPLMGSTDDPAEMAQLSDLEGPPSSVLKKELEKAMREIKAEGGSVSFDMDEDEKITWGTSRQEQVSMRMEVSDDELDLAAPAPSGSFVGMPKAKSRKADTDSVFDDVVELPEDSGILGRRSAVISKTDMEGLTEGRVQNFKPMPTEKVASPTRVRKAPSTHEIRPEEMKAKRGGLGAVLGMLGGLAAGAAGMYFAGPLLKDSKTENQSEAKNDAGNRANPQPEGASFAEAQRLLAGGDPETASAILKNIKNDSPEVRSTRGQALWMSRVRHFAGQKKPLNPRDSELNIARTDLQYVVDRFDELKTPEEQKAGLRAALNLGLIHEATGAPDKALKLYTSSAAKLPQFKRVFDTAASRVTAMRKLPNGNKVLDKDYVLGGEPLLNLAGANLILLEFDPVAEIAEEPGFHFWDAVVSASDETRPEALTDAIKSVKAARDLHEKHRRKYAGQGQNPLSDPSEQIFLRACDELEQYWNMKRTIYANPVAAEMAKGDAVNKPMNIQTIVIKLLESKQKEKDFDRTLATLKADNDKFLARATTAERERTAAEAAKLSLQTDRDNLTKQVKDANKDLNAAKAQAVAAENKVKTTETAIDLMILKLKTARLIDEKATREEALAMLPKVTIGATGSNAEMAKELTDLRAKYDKEKTEAVSMRQSLTAKMKDLENTLKNDAEAKIAAAKKENQEKEDAWKLQLQKAKADADALLIAEARKRKEMEEAHTQQIIAARSGSAIIVSDAERDRLARADRDYDRGIEAYFAGRYADAEKSLANARDLNANDARIWYFLGLAKVQQGRGAEAVEDFRKGAKLEERNLPGRQTVSEALINVQFAPRAQLEAARP